MLAPALQPWCLWEFAEVPESKAVRGRMGAESHRGHSQATVQGLGEAKSIEIKAGRVTKQVTGPE